MKHILALVAAGLALAACNDRGAAGDNEAALANQAEAVENAAENAVGDDKALLDNAAETLGDQAAAAGGKPEAENVAGADETPADKPAQ